MFDRLLGPKFSNKCKQSVKCIKCRLEAIRKKKHAMERCLKKDIADLVSAGHDANAFGRMDALLFEINQTSCYNIIEQYCCCILEHLPTMQKERECPKETVETVATLIFAAARFPDLPELADLRRGFTERYRTTMESHTNREFVEKLQKKSFPQDKKLQLMKDIAKEFSIDWDVKSFEYKTASPLAPTIDHPMAHCPSNNKNSIEFQERREVTDRRNEGLNGRMAVLEKTDGIGELTKRRNEILNGRKPAIEKSEGTTCLASDVQKLQIEFQKLKTLNSYEDRKTKQMEEDGRHCRSAMQKHQVQTEVHRNTPPTPKDVNVHQHDSTQKIKKVAADQCENVEPYHFSKRPPPYAKAIGNQNGNAPKRSEVYEEPDLVGIERRDAIRNDKAIHLSPPDTKFTEDYNGTNFYHDGFFHYTTKEVVKEMKHNRQQRQSNGAVSPESKKAFNLKPPYLKPKVKSLLETDYVKPTNYEMYSGIDNGYDHKNSAFSVRRKHLVQGAAAHIGSTGEDGNLPWKISTKKYAGVVTKNNVLHMDLNDQQVFSLQSKEIEDDATDGVVSRSHLMHQTYIDQTIHGRRGTNVSYDGVRDKEEGKKTDKLLQHYSKKGVSNERGKARKGTKEAPTQSIYDSSRVSQKN